jgi:hypothetical protein
MRQHARWLRGACLAISLGAAIATLKAASVESLALAGPTGAAGLSLPSEADNPVLLVKDDKPKKGCNLCNDKGYCLIVDNEGTCQAQKTAIEKHWGPDFKWRCICSKKPKSSSSSGKQVCCWFADNPKYKGCGDERRVKNALLAGNPPGVIECGPYQQP